MSDPHKIENAGNPASSPESASGEPAAVPNASAAASANASAEDPRSAGAAAKPALDEAKEKVLAAKASREMWTAILIIVGSFVFVLVAAALVIIVGHIQLF